MKINIISVSQQGLWRRTGSVLAHTSSNLHGWDNRILYYSEGTWSELQFPRTSTVQAGFCARLIFLPSFCIVLSTKVHHKGCETEPSHSFSHTNHGTFDSPGTKEIPEFALTPWIPESAVTQCQSFILMQRGSEGTHLLLCWLPGTPSAPEVRLTCPCWGHSSQWNVGHISWAWLSSLRNVWKASAPACWCHYCCCCPAGWSTSVPLAPPVCGWGLAQRTWNRGSTGPRQVGALTNTVKHMLRSQSWHALCHT